MKYLNMVQLLFHITLTPSIGTFDNKNDNNNVNIQCYKVLYKGSPNTF